MIGEGLSRVPEGHTHRDTPPPQRQVSYVEYKEPKSGRPVQVLHPEIEGLDKMPYKAIRPEAVVPIRLGQKTVEAAFIDYLGMNGANYAEYESGLKQKLSHRELLRKLHQDSLNRRLKDAMTAQSLPKHEGHEVARKEIEGFFIKLINESRYGEALEGTLQNDHEDKIDFFLKLDPADFALEEEIGADPVYIGIQHTALDEQRRGALFHKERQIKHVRGAYIPEHPEYGMVTKIMMREDRREYFPGGGQISYDFVLSRRKNQMGKTPKVWEAFMYDDLGKRNSVTEHEARQMVTDRVRKIYQHVAGTLETYKSDPATPYRELSNIERKQKIVNAVLESLQ